MNYKEVERMRNLNIVIFCTKNTNDTSELIKNYYFCIIIQKKHWRRY